MTDKEPQTPAQRAKEFARDNGFSITPEGRRYCITHNASPECLSVVATVGGYDAALNAMKRWLNEDERKTAESITHIERVIDPATLLEPAKVHCDVVRDDGALGMYADTVVGGRNANAVFGKMAVPDECAASGASCSYLPHGIHSEMQCQYCGKPKGVTLVDAINAVQIGGGVTLDRIGKEWKMRERLPGETDAAYRDLLLYGGPLMPKVATGAVLDEWAALNSQTWGRIAKQRRKASGKPPGGPWHVIFNGRQLTKPGYPTRAAAVAVVRWGFNHSDATIRNNWRTAALSVEYR